MKNATIGLLLSGLVFPGAGHLFLKAYKKAMILISLTLFSFISIVVTILSQLDTALEKLQAEGGKIDLDSVTLTVNQAVSPQINVYSLFSTLF